MCALKIKLYAHTYRDTTEIQHYAISIITPKLAKSADQSGFPYMYRL